MKKYIVVMLLITLKSYSQELEFNNFKYTNGNLIWRKVYTTNATTNDVINSLTTSGIIKNVSHLKTPFTSLKNSFTGTIEDLKLDYLRFGKTRRDAPDYIPDSFLQCLVLVELKENKYRITLKEMKLKGSPDHVYASERGQLTDLSFYSLKGIEDNKASFRFSFTKTTAGILNFTFDRYFKNIITPEDW